MSLEQKRFLSYSAVMFWMAVIFVFSHQDASISSSQSGVIVDFFESITAAGNEGLLTFLVRKSAHIIVYFILGLLLYGLINTYNLKAKLSVVVCMLVALAYATFDEVHQLFIPGRSGELRDVLIDTVAATAGVLLLLSIDKLAKNKAAN